MCFVIFLKELQINFSSVQFQSKIRTVHLSVKSYILGLNNKLRAYSGMSAQIQQMAPAGSIKTTDPDVEQIFTYLGSMLKV